MFSSDRFGSIFFLATTSDGGGADREGKEEEREEVRKQGRKRGERWKGGGGQH